MEGGYDTARPRRQYNMIQFFKASTAGQKTKLKTKLSIFTVVAASNGSHQIELFVQHVFEKVRHFVSLLKAKVRVDFFISFGGS
jgi:hypothetical protein